MTQRFNLKRREATPIRKILKFALGSLPITFSFELHNMTSTLGKRKEREENSADTFSHGSVLPNGLYGKLSYDIVNRSTLFVSNLPYTATSTDLQTLFSDLAPVRSAFVVLEQGTGVSKGVGYVAFAIKEDAQSAFESISNDGIILDSRKLRVQWADIKVRLCALLFELRSDHQCSQRMVKR